LGPFKGGAASEAINPQIPYYAYSEMFFDTSQRGGGGKKTKKGRACNKGRAAVNNPMFEVPSDDGRRITEKKEKKWEIVIGIVPPSHKQKEDNPLEGGVDSA